MKQPRPTISNGVAVPVSFSGNDVFGQMVTAGRTPQVAIPFFQSVPSLLMTVTSSGTGVSGSGVGVGQFSTGAGVSGALAMTVWLVEVANAVAAAA